MKKEVNSGKGRTSRMADKSLNTIGEESTAKTRGGLEYSPPLFLQRPDSAPLSRWNWFWFRVIFSSAPSHDVILTSTKFIFQFWTLLFADVSEGFHRPYLEIPSSQDYQAFGCKFKFPSSFLISYLFGLANFPCIFVKFYL